MLFEFVNKMIVTFYQIELFVILNLQSNLLP